MAARLQIAEKDWAKYRFALIQEVTFKQPTYINDGKHAFGPQELKLRLSPDDCLYEHKFLTDDVLGLDHMDKSKRANGYREGGLVIKG